MELKDRIKEYAELSKTIKITQEKIKVLNKRKKQLYTELLPKLKSNNVEKCNLSFGTLKIVETNRKVLPNKATMKERYTDFFNSRCLEQDYITGTPQQKAEILFAFIYTDSVEYKKESNLNMVYSKEFKDQLKELNPT
jgi:hypothetical protein